MSIASGGSATGPWTAAALAATIPDRSAAGIAATVNRLISTGRLGHGERLPTVRDLAAALGTSPATVAEAWRALKQAGAIVPRGRAGSFVDTPTRWMSRYREMPAAPRAQLTLDLSTGVPDPALLPDVGPALGRVSRRATTSNYLDPAVLPPLEARLRADWPYDVQALTVVDGALDGLERVLRLTVRLGDHVLVEHPAFPPLLDLLDGLGAVVVPVELDARGPRPSSLTERLAQLRPARPVAMVLQPRAHNPTGASLTPARAGALARILRRDGGDVLVVEDDHSGAIAAAPDVSLGRWLPERTVHVRSFSKSHGPDLRLAALGGPRDVVTAVERQRRLGPGWTSRMLQEVLLDLLTETVAVEAVRNAGRVYARRRSGLAQALLEHGVRVAPGDGLAMWLPVADERRAVVTLAGAGVGVTPGAPFHACPDGGCLEVGGRVRLTIGTLPDDAAQVGELARLVAAAAS
ncbi:aminotransferase class I/II-fold pyridoxal phosphate-dependent enzyme [Spongisporangium articulatum]|uniref:Aminotransferase class I/II-fold pyridoxal phosphate-dependent enzyme n=1 Tax=Spongisporangium articulatum TaxID=3362603 RepID=A0ABW8AHJ9_9ACTN